jgi:phosphoribulokinase
MTTVLCLDDYHLNDRQGRKKTNLTALNVAEQNFDLMAEQLVNLKTGKSISKPIYNHVNGTIDKPETITPTPIVIVEGLHPLVDPRVRRLLDFTIYLDISDEIKFAWKIQRDMEERGWIREQVQADIEKRKPDFAAFVAPQMQFSDMVISVLPSTRGLKSVGGMPGLKVKLLQRVGKRGLPPAYMVDADSHVTIRPSARLVRAQSEGGLQLVSYRDRFYDHEVSVLEMEGRVADAQGFAGIERLLSDTGARTPTEISSLMQSGSASTPGALDGTGLFQTIAAVKLRNYYEHATGTKIGA